MSIWWIHGIANDEDLAKALDQAAEKRAYDEFDMFTTGEFDLLKLAAQRIRELSPE